MQTPKVFEPGPGAVAALISAHPLALLVSNGGDRLVATPLPLLCEEGQAGDLTLIGHFARSNPQVGCLRADPAALAIFMGPHGYISPSWMRDRSQAPTWNFACVQLHVRVHFSDERVEAVDAVERLTSAMENRRARAWSAYELGPRFDRLISGVVPFKAQVLDVTGKFKLGQNERDDVLGDILSGLVAEGSNALADLMRSANDRRAQGSDAC